MQRSTLYLLAALAATMGIYLFWWKSQQDNSGNGADDSGGGVLDTIRNAGARLVNALTSRGYRNNNPGNLRYIAKNPWQGQIGNDNGYGIYDTPQNGTRALGHQLRAYGDRGLNTVKLIISTWAPSSDNDTIAYIGDMSTQLT